MITPKFEEARADEKNGLLRRGTFKTVLEKSVSKSENTMVDRFVLTIKEVGTKNEIYKAIFIVRAHTDAENGYWSNHHLVYGNKR